MRIVIIDNYDSFTYNLVHIVEQFCEQVIVMRNDQINWKQIKNCDKLIFSPGPGLPKEVKVMGEILDQYANSKPILGVCLGMQYIGEYFGAELINLKEIVHGVPKTTLIADDNELLFKNIPSKFDSGRYHSWALSKNNFPECLRITARDEQDVIMAIRHKKLNLCGVQFHPESIMTQYGKEILKNWILNQA
ncbi:aminodeoxychorismate/anthranilate synthase component II [Labilibaculum manganireducens]|uniref:Aminodeoxychorismate/anthranilate synthase component II n=1 Tax=Labilibaculum manganireducens TaxID=1940525 RepID=A0A2N3IGP9_9BACT|nr:aminodeoxychorismate/anthranilate synthase component II [Labilibaculum manganireducens]PKQ69486.1 aminodeoxychorismate/anthranilate synthase component II [Labilibaculum manganireducens]